MTARVLIGAVACAIAGSTAVTVAQFGPRDYPQWLGRNRDGAASAFEAPNDDAELVVAKASRSGFEPLKRYTVADSATWAQPAISGNRIFIKDMSTLTLWTLDSR